MINWAFGEFKFVGKQADFSTSPVVSASYKSPLVVKWMLYLTKFGNVSTFYVVYHWSSSDQTKFPQQFIYMKISRKWKLLA